MNKVIRAVMVVLLWCLIMALPVSAQDRSYQATASLKDVKQSLLSPEKYFDDGSTAYIYEANDAIGCKSITLMEGVSLTAGKVVSANTTFSLDISAEGASSSGNVTLSQSTSRFVLRLKDDESFTGKVTTILSGRQVRIHESEPDEDGVITRTYYIADVADKNVSYEASLTLEDSIAVNFYMRFPAGTKDSELSHYSVTTNFKGQPVTPTMTTDGQNLSCIAASAKAYEMTKPVKIKVLYDGDVIKTFDYSVQQYFINKLADRKASNFSTYEPIYRAALDYGAQAQLYFDGKTYGNGIKYVTMPDKLANETSNPSNDITQLPEVAEPEEALRAKVTNKLPDITKVSATLVLDATTAIRYRITDPSCRSASDFARKYSFSAAGLPLSYDYLGSSVYAIELPGLAASDLRHPYTLTVSDGTQEMEITYSAAAYMYNTYTKSTDEKLRRLCITMFAYAEAAAALWPDA